MKIIKIGGRTVLQALLILLAVIGLLISLYFAGVYYNYLRSDIWWVPVFCRMKQQTCQSIVKTPEARVFGIPNFVLGSIFYTVLIAAVIGNISGFLFDILLTTAIFTVTLAVYLIYALRVRLKTDCPLCYIAHTINIIIAILLIVSKYTMV
jgi:uncharacterized membrane protein